MRLEKTRSIPSFAVRWSAELGQLPFQPAAQERNVKVEKYKWVRERGSLPDCFVTLSNGTVLEIPAEQKRLVTEEEKHGRGLVYVQSANVPEEIQVSEWNYSFEGPHKFTKDRDIVSLAKELVDACRTGTFEEKEVKLDD